MNATDIKTSNLTHSAITSLMNAYERCSDNVVKESIVTAYKAVMMLNHGIVISDNFNAITESDVVFDESEYCAAV
jgi:hypothetical protein